MRRKERSGGIRQAIFPNSRSQASVTLKNRNDWPARFAENDRLLYRVSVVVRQQFADNVGLIHAK